MRRRLRRHAAPGPRRHADRRWPTRTCAAARRLVRGQRREVGVPRRRARHRLRRGRAGRGRDLRPGPLRPADDPRAVRRPADRPLAARGRASARRTPSGRSWSPPRSWSWSRTCRSRCYLARRRPRGRRRAAHAAAAHGAPAGDRPDPSQLVAANVASSADGGLGTFVGPAVAGLLLAPGRSGRRRSSRSSRSTPSGSWAIARLHVPAVGRPVAAWPPRSTRSRPASGPSRRCPGRASSCSTSALQTFVRGLLTVLRRRRRHRAAAAWASPASGRSTRRWAWAASLGAAVAVTARRPRAPRPGLPARPRRLGCCRSRSSALVPTVGRGARWR